MTILRHPRPPRVLIVDNEPAICRALSIVLQREGFEAIASPSGEAALARLRSETFDVMLLDLRMPELRGDVLFHYAVALQPHLERRTIFMTGDISLKAQEITDTLGCPVLLKPFDLKDVCGALWSIIEDRNEGMAG